MTEELKIKTYEKVLKPCPFCGGKATMSESDGCGFTVRCRNYSICEVNPYMLSQDTPEEAVEKWNTRKGEGKVE